MTDEKLLQEVRVRAMGMGFGARWLILELAERYERLKEPKMLKIYPARGSGKSGPLVRALRDLDFARTEGIKEFAERLCNGRVSNDPVVIAVKVELKEMVGDEK